MVPLKRKRLIVEEKRQMLKIFKPTGSYEQYCKRGSTEWEQGEGASTHSFWTGKFSLKVG